MVIQKTVQELSRKLSEECLTLAIADIIVWMQCDRMIGKMFVGSRMFDFAFMSLATG